MIGLPSNYFPRCLVAISLVLDDQIPGSPGTPVPPAYTVIPRDVEVDKNDARTADICRVQLDYRDFPFDPRAIRGAHVVVHLDGLLDPLVPMIPSRLNARFIGLIDEMEADHSGGGERVSLRCRDYTGLGLDLRWSAVVPSAPAPAPPTPFPIAGTFQSVVEAVRLLVWPLTLPAVFLDPTVAAQSLALKLGKLTWTAKDGDSVWQVLTDMCAVFGQVPVWNLDQLEIRPPALPKPGAASFVYGQNLESLKFKRDYRGRKEKPVRVVAWDPTKGLALEAQYPPLGDPRGVKKKQKAGVAGLPGAGGAAVPSATPEYLQYNVEGAYTPVDLLALAMALYTESRQETTGELTTKDLDDLAGLSILGLSNGDPITVALWPDVMASIASMSPPEAIAFLSDPFRANSLSPIVAAALVDAWTRAQTMTPLWHVKSAKHAWNVESGYKLVVEFQNYILG